MIHGEGEAEDTVPFWNYDPPKDNINTSNNSNSSDPTTTTTTTDWRTLPARVRALVQYIETTQHNSTTNNHTNHVTATTMTSPPPPSFLAQHLLRTTPKENEVSSLATTNSTTSLVLLTTAVTAKVLATATAENFFHPFRTLFLHLLAKTMQDSSSSSSSAQEEQADDDDDDDEEMKLVSPNNESSSSWWEENDTTRTFWNDLQYLQWLLPTQRTGLLWRTFEEAIHTTIQQKIQTVMEDYDENNYHDTPEEVGTTTNDDDEEEDGSRLLYPHILHWAQSTLLPWIQHRLYVSSSSSTSTSTLSWSSKQPTKAQHDENISMTDINHHHHNNNIHNSIADWSVRIQTTCADCFGRLRIHNIFNIVADYPESLPAVRDLRKVLEPTGLQTTLAHTLKESLHRRLCHPGATTNQIIEMYVNTIKVLRVIDPSDRLLTEVAEPVRQYLRGRADTVRSIIASLTNANHNNTTATTTTTTTTTATTTTSNDLYQELRRQDAKPLEDVADDSDNEEDCPTLDWYPPPSIHQPKGSFLEASLTTTGSSNHNHGSEGGGGGGGDILAMLVSIYGSKELFVNEYRIMLADKLLANLDYNVDQEVHTLELLKLRFGEASMRSCEVMIKDLNDSKRTNTNIRSFLEPHADTIVDAVMVSHIFWPSLHDESMKHHPRLQYMLDVFAKEYARLKNPRILLWFHQLGTVEIEAEVIENDGRTTVKNFSCSPLLATLLAHFEDKPQWTAIELSNETGLGEHLIQKRMAYWVSQKVLRLVTQGVEKPTYVLAGVDYLSSTNADSFDNHAFHHHHNQHHDDEVAGVSAAAQEEEEMDVYLSYIVGMLTNLGSLPLKTIHNNLKNFVTGSEIRYNKTPQQLGLFLQRLCKEERLEVGPDGMYKLFKK
jgi:anaphase-promoting complex subunit 2